MRILIIQTSFIGDVILATPVLEKLRQFYPSANIVFLVRKGNEGLFEYDRRISHLLIWEKRKSKWKNLLKIIKEVRASNYDLIINLHRHLSSGLITALSGSDMKVGFKKNPLSIFFDRAKPYRIGDGTHEVNRTLTLLEDFCDNNPIRPGLEIPPELMERVEAYKDQSYITIAPASVWFTKQLPEEKWVELIQNIKHKDAIYLLGSKADHDLCKSIIQASGQRNAINLAGTLDLLESAALMRDARMNFVNDSAPLHLASSVNAPVCAVFCSTIPKFGFGPLSENSRIIESGEHLPCRPCGLHGHRKCPKGHFKCATSIEVDRLLEVIASI